MTGFLGRSAVFELLTLTPELRELVASGATMSGVEARARDSQGMRSLRESGARKVAEGRTTVDEVLRATTI
jgi:type II secretory ATPase GspE/PulE/Tfp pilus assembly ATPase PilB-like protein